MEVRKIELQDNQKKTAKVGGTVAIIIGSVLLFLSGAAIGDITHIVDVVARIIGVN